MPKTPFFWYRRSPTTHLIGVIFFPLTWLWRMGSWLRQIGSRPYGPRLPVIAVGNITAGGTGKTPLVANLAVEARLRGYKPVILTRGYGGQLAGPICVDKHHAAADIGDEALMLREYAPVVVSRNRASGAKFIEEETLGDLILMDDGLQNPSMKPHQSVVVFKGSLGIGNGQIIPAGPLREALSTGLAHADAVAFTGRDDTGLTAQIRQIAPDLPCFTITRALNAEDLGAISGGKVVAFAGIGDPDGFFDMLAMAGVDLIARRVFPDHHLFRDDEIKVLTAMAEDQQAILVTTEKDLVRIPEAVQHGILCIRLETRADPGLIDKLLPRR